MAATNVATFRQFYEDKDFWQPDDWHEGDCPIVGEELDQNALVSINGGSVFRNEEYLCTFEEFFERWLSRQMMKTILVNVPNDKYEDMVKAIKELGGTICES